HGFLPARREIIHSNQVYVLLFNTLGGINESDDWADRMSSMKAFIKNERVGIDMRGVIKGCYKNYGENNQRKKIHGGHSGE
ncbi:Hypothetical protein CINCED_3A001043, partial [Cinara cedri]